MNSYDFNWGYIVSLIPDLLNGIKITLYISCLTSIISLVVGLCLAIFRMSKSRFVKVPSSSFVEFFRNTPLLVQIYLCYSGLPHLGISFSAEFCGIISLSLYSSAYITEVIRSGIQSIPKEQFEAARSLGLSSFKTLCYIIMPQALRIAIPPLGNQFINIVKNSSLVSFITVTDLYYVIYKGSTDDFRSIECFFIGGVLYITMVGAVALLTNLLENRCKIPEMAG